MRVFLDTNVIVSAFATRGLCSDLVQLILLEHELVVGETVLTELRRVFHQRLKLSAAAIDSVESYLRRQATVVPAQTAPSTSGLDRADATVLAEAAAGTADVLVTSDRDLLEAKSTSIKVVSPRGLWELFRGAT